jgi:hypothetical protein
MTPALAEPAPPPSGKIERTEALKRIIPGAIDRVGNKVVHVLAAGDEFVIYEIDHPDINYRLRVMIDGVTADSEKIIKDRFARIKQKYIEAKGLLYRATNYSMMKNRVAHALSTALSTDSIDASIEFDNLIASIKKESNEVVHKRILYILPTTLFFFAAAVGVILFLAGFLPLFGTFTRDGLMIVSAASLGGGLSVLVSTRNLRFEEYCLRWYVILGTERVFISLASSSIAYILIRSKILLPQISESSNPWSMMSILVIAAFSEALIPSILGRIEKKLQTPPAP